MGYDNLDALDPCDEMLDVARGRGIYKKYYVEGISGDKTTIAESTSMTMTLPQFHYYSTFWKLKTAVV